MMPACIDIFGELAACHIIVCFYGFFFPLVCLNVVHLVAEDANINIRHLGCWMVDLPDDRFPFRIYIRCRSYGLRWLNGNEMYFL